MNSGVSVISYTIVASGAALKTALGTIGLNHQYCIPSTSPCVTLSGICINGSGWYNYPGCSNAYYCSRTIAQYTVPAGYFIQSSLNRVD